MQNLKRKATRTLVTGRSGSGKSSYLEFAIRTDNADRIFIFDPEGEFSERLHLPITTQLADITQLNDGRPQNRIVCYASDDSPVNTDFEDFCLFVFEYCKVANQTVLIVIDELQRYVNAYSLPDAFVDAMFRGRRYGLNMLLSSQQANLIHNSVRSTITQVVSFAQSDENAIKFGRMVGIEGVEKLPDMHCRIKRMGHDGVRACKMVYEKNRPVLVDTDAPPGDITSP